MAAVVATPVPAAAVQAPPTRRMSERLANSIQVSIEKTPGFYSRIGRRMMHGSADGKPTFEEVIITGLGMATKTAIGTASMIEKDQQGFIKSIETSYFPSARIAGRRLPKVTIVVVKNPAAPIMDVPKTSNPSTAPTTA